MEEQNRVTLNSIQINSMLMFAGKYIVDFIHTVMDETNNKSKIKIVDLNDQISVSYPINIYDLLINSKLYIQSLVKQQHFKEDNLLFLKKYVLQLDINKRPCHIPTELMKIGFENVFNGDPTLMKRLCDAILLVILNEVIPAVLITFDIVKERDAKMLQYAFGNKIALTNIFLTLNYNQKDNMICFDLISNIGEVETLSKESVLTFKVTTSVE